MPGATPNQAFAYPLPAESPGQLAGTWATFALQVDAKGAVYDSDTARIAANTFVKVSVTNVPLFTDPPIFDTVEVNRGTPTDLSAFNGVILNPGFWAIGASVTYTPAVVGAKESINIRYAPIDNARQPSLAWPLSVSRDDFGLYSGGSAGLMNLPQQTLSVLDIALIQTQTQVSLLLNTGSWAWPYIDLWAFQVGDF